MQTLSILNLIQWRMTITTKNKPYKCVGSPILPKAYGYWKHRLRRFLSSYKSVLPTLMSCNRFLLFSMPLHIPFHVALLCVSTLFSLCFECIEMFLLIIFQWNLFFLPNRDNFHAFLYSITRFGIKIHFKMIK